MVVVSFELLYGQVEVENRCAWLNSIQVELEEKINWSVEACFVAFVIPFRVVQCSFSPFIQVQVPVLWQRKRENQAKQQQQPKPTPQKQDLELGNAQDLETPQQAGGVVLRDEPYVRAAETKFELIQQIHGMLWACQGRCDEGVLTMLQKHH